MVADRVIVELKSIKQIAKAHEVQLVNYLCATGKDVGLIINFGEKGIETKRKVRDMAYYSKKMNSPVCPVNSFKIENI